MALLRQYVVALACAVLLRSQTALPPLPQLHDSGFSAGIRGQIQRVASEARAHPTDAAAVGALGMTLHAYQQYEAAAQAYARAHVLEPQSFDWVYLLGTTQFAAGDFDSAEVSFRSALALRPGDLPAQLRLAQSLSATAKWDRSASLYRAILDKHADSAQAWYGLGRALAAAGDHAGAAESYAKACALFPAYGAAHFALAGEFRKLGKVPEVEWQIEAYAEHVTVEPPLDDPLFERIHDLNHSAQTHLQRGVELEKAGQIQAAIGEHEMALAADPNDVQARINLISLYARAGKSEEAARAFDTAIRLNAGRSDAWYDYGVLLLQERKFTEAEVAFRKAVEINPSYAEAHYNLGAIAEREGRMEEAERGFREAITNQPDYSAARFRLGRILVNQEDYRGGITQFTRALERPGKEKAVYLYALAAAYARSGDRTQALRYFREARDVAAARGQAQLLSAIDRDLSAFGSNP